MITYENEYDKQLFEGLTIHQIVESLKETIKVCNQEAKNFYMHKDTSKSWYDRTKQARKSLQFYKKQIK